MLGLGEAAAVFWRIDDSGLKSLQESSTGKKLYRKYSGQFAGSLKLGWL